MTEAEALELVAAYIANSHTNFNMYISFTFAYLATAFFVGSKLTGFQAMAVSCLYLISATAALLAFIANVQMYAEIAESTATLLDKLPLGDAMLWIFYLSGVMSIGLFASLYFMWDVRHRDTE